jgi:FAD/FMN-containing dehydrogenase/Fe-S oxidoreductase
MNPIVRNPTTVNFSSDHIKAFKKSLESDIDGEVRFDRISRALYSTDASVYQIIPAGVVLPRSESDVVHSVRTCKEFGIPLTARGGGTSQGGQAVGHGIQIDFSKYLNKIIDVNPEERTVTVEPGIVLDNLNSEIKKHGLHLPLDISTANQATIGGMIANNSAGTRSIIYGKTIDYVLAMKVVLSDGSSVEMSPLTADELDTKCRKKNLEGTCYSTVRKLAEENKEEILKRYPKILRRVGGYNLDEFIHADRPFNLSRIMVGSEGTLGLAVQMTMRLVTLSKCSIVCSIQFKSVLEALSVTPAILEHSPSAVELIDKLILDTTHGKTEFEPLRGFITGDPGAILIVEFTADTRDEVTERLERLETGMQKSGFGTGFYRAVHQSEQDRIWKLRQAALGLTMAKTGDAKAISFVEDTAVSPNDLHDYIKKFQDILKRHGTKAGFYAHASVGILHVRPVINMKAKEGIEKFALIAEEISDLVLEYGGALSGEHGDGFARSPFQKKMFGPVLYEAFCSVKKAFDPNSIFNPGKIVHAPPITENLRFGTGYVPSEQKTVFDFSDFGGISQAVEQCSGVGACRKLMAGTMCPSYMVTADESDVTRGRANALRLALSGQLEGIEFGDRDLMPIMDLCLECKACKSECPTGVDLARVKSEYLNAYNKKYGIPLQAKLLASIAKYSHLGSRHSFLMNTVTRNRIFRAALELVFGIDSRRTLPRFAGQTFLQWYNRNQSGKNAGTTKTAAFFPDTFTNFFDPEYAICAIKTARKLGWNTIVPERVCCGRPLISKGLLEDAAQQAQKIIHNLAPLAEKQIPIVFCEPGCYSAVRDDIPKLVQNSMKETAELVASVCVTFEEWADKAVSDNDNALSILSYPNSGLSEILLHGHCHQKALVGMQPAVSLFSRIQGCRITVLDSGCCGMAGSFGYEKKHYSISRKIGERVLFPAVRDKDPDTVVVATGFSCRQQIHHFTGIQSLSTAQILHSILEKR